MLKVNDAINLIYEHMGTAFNSGRLEFNLAYRSEDPDGRLWLCGVKEGYCAYMVRIRAEKAIIKQFGEPCVLVENSLAVYGRGSQRVEYKARTNAIMDSSVRRDGEPDFFKVLRNKAAAAPVIRVARHPLSDVVNAWNAHIVRIEFVEYQSLRIVSESDPLVMSEPIPYWGIAPVLDGDVLMFNHRFLISALEPISAMTVDLRLIDIDKPFPGVASGKALVIGNADSDGVLICVMSYWTGAR